MKLRRTRHAPSTNAPIAPDRASVRELLRSRFKYGLLKELAHELGLPASTLGRLRQGRGAFPASKLEAVRALLLRERKDPAEEVRALLRARLAQGRVRASQVARACGVSRSTISRFLSGKMSLRPETLTQVVDCLDAKPGRMRGGLPARAREVGPEDATMRFTVRSRTALPGVLRALAEDFARSLVDAVCKAPLGELVSA